MLLGLWAQRRVKTTFARYSEVQPQNGMTGAQAAQAVLDASGLPGVSINQVKGRLTDHYNPRDRSLNLSEPVGAASTISAVGVAAHEAGHAIQHADGYGPMKIRQTLVPVARFGSSLWFFPVVIGLMAGLSGLVTIGLILFAGLVLFQLVTLPVEFDASKRALVALENQGLLVGGEVDGARKVLSAAAWTYIAAFVASLAQLIYFFLLSRR
jgi:Zn-dependent membrane protease YugP